MTQISLYENEKELTKIMELIENDLSEPYCIYTYRYFLHNWPDLCFLARSKKDEKIVGVVIARVEPHKSGTTRGYIAMLAVHPEHRKMGIGIVISKLKNLRGSQLVLKSLAAIKEKEASEIVLEAEESNKAAIALYERIGFFRDKRLEKYYLNGSDAFRLKMVL